MDSINSSDQKIKKQRKLKMEQLSYDSDIKRVQRERENVRLEIKRYEADLQRLRVTINDTQAREKKLALKEQFFHDEVTAIKKKLINLEH